MILKACLVTKGESLQNGPNDFGLKSLLKIYFFIWLTALIEFEDTRVYMSVFLFVLFLISIVFIFHFNLIFVAFIIV